MKINDVLFNDSKIKIFGINQFSKTDHDKLDKEILKMELKPDAIVIESCEERAGHSGINMEAFKTHASELNLFQHSKIIHGDRPISITMSRLFNEIKHFTKAQLGREIGESLYESSNPQKSSKKSACEQVSSNQEFQNFKTVILDERQTYFASKIKTESKNFKNMVAIVNESNFSGVSEKIVGNEILPETVEKLLTIPKKYEFKTTWKHDVCMGLVLIGLLSNNRSRKWLLKGDAIKQINNGIDLAILHKKKTIVGITVVFGGPKVYDLTK